MLLWGLIYSCIILNFSRTYGQECTWGNYTDGTNYDTDSSHKSFLVIDEPLCAGKINEWRFAVNLAPSCHPVVFQVYRPVSGAYQLVGENGYDPRCSRPVEIVPIHEAFQIPVQAGDLIGWTDNINTFPRMFEYSEGLPGSNQVQTVRILDTSCTTAGSVCDWSQYVAEEGRRYSLEAQVITGDNPFIDNLRGRTYVDELQPGGTPIYQVIGSNDRNYNEIVLANFTYSFLNNYEEFQIDAITGVVSTLKELDHESQASHTLTINVTQGVQFVNQSTLNVIVSDINEPHTLQPLSDVSLNAEITVNGEIIYTDIIVDDVDDPGVFGQKNFILVNTEPAADIFRVERVAPETAKLVCTELLWDWQGPEVIDLYISASDDHFTSGPEKMTVTIYNIWQPPTIDNLPNAVTLSETTPVDYIYTVTGSHDNRVRSPLQYEIVAVYPPQRVPPAMNPFSIDNQGRVSYVGDPKFDFMEVKTYEVEIQAYDGKFYSDLQNLTVDIAWDNKAPVLNSSVYDSRIPELSPVGTLLPGVVLQATDRDIPLGDWLDYILSGPGSHLFHANNITNTVFVKGELLCDPGQLIKTYDLIITVTDSFGETDSGTLTVEVTDVNNHIPVFTDTSYEGSVSELSKGATTVLPISASDNDAGENADMSFVVVEEYAKIYFEVIPFCDSSPCTRQLQMKQPISHVDFPNITFTLMVFDHGIPSLNSTTSVYVKVVDENNHPPEFLQEYYNLETRTDMPDDSEVANVEVYDPDTDINSNVSFLLLIPTRGFRIEEATGIIRNKYGMEAYSTHIFYVYARDWASPEYYSNPCVVRMDTYTPKHHLIDIHMDIPLSDFIHIKEEFLKKLNQNISPWYAKEEQQLLDPDQSILTIYALDEKPSESIEHLDEPKIFVHRNELLARLRVNIPGKPQDWLREEEFADYEVFKILPTYPVWLIDTIGGIVTLTLLCLLFILMWVAIFYAIFRGCKKPKAKVGPMVTYPKPEEYALQYGDYAHVHYNPKKGVISTPIVPFMTSTKKKKTKTPKVVPEEKVEPPAEEVKPEETYVAELPPVESTTGISAFPNKPLPPSGQSRIL